ncbi:MAG: NarK/NasA family nitrate transporter [Nitrospirae bacterium]|nr:NarK/NasA family nitrate transporter [Nitrospirota bacterium]
MRTALGALRSGHWPSLVGAWLHFEVSFMVWLLIGALGVSIAEEFGLTATQKGLLVALPLLGGALLRVVVGPCSDRFGAKPTGLALLLCEFLAVLWGWLGATSYLQVLGVGLFLGVAGASFAVALPLASRAYPPAHQGLAMGVAASANSGTVLAAFFAPRLGQLVGWHGVFGLMIVPVLLTTVLFAALVRGDTGIFRQESRPQWWGTMVDMLRLPSAYWLCCVYAVTFGGFVGFCSFLPIFFHDQYGLDLVAAGTMTAACGLAGSLTRPFGGYTADRLGGLKVLGGVFLGIAALTGAIGQLPHLTQAATLMVIAVATMGFGNGVVFQVVSDRFQKQIGTASGLIGAAGGFGGFLLPSWLGLLKDVTGTYGSGFLLFALVCVAAWLSVALAIRRSRRMDNRLNDVGHFPH